MIKNKPCAIYNTQMNWISLHCIKLWEAYVGLVSMQARWLVRMQWRMRCTPPLFPSSPLKLVSLSQRTHWDHPHSIANLWVMSLVLAGATACFSQSTWLSIWSPLFSSGRDANLGEWTAIIRNPPVAATGPIQYVPSEPPKENPTVRQPTCSNPHTFGVARHLVSPEHGETWKCARQRIHQRSGLQSPNSKEWHSNYQFRGIKTTHIEGAWNLLSKELHTIGCGPTNFLPLVFPSTNLGRRHCNWKLYLNLYTRKLSPRTL